MNRAAVDAGLTSATDQANYRTSHDMKYNFLLQSLFLAITMKVNNSLNFEKTWLISVSLFFVVTVIFSQAKFIAHDKVFTRF